MATMNVKDAAGATVAVEKPLVPGQATSANSRPVVIASDQSTVPVSLASVPSHAVTLASTTITGTVAATQSGTWNVGTITTLPALVAGSALIGKVDVQFAGTAPDLGSGTGGSKTQRVIIDSSQFATAGQRPVAEATTIIQPSDANLYVTPEGVEYETVAAGVSTPQILGATGAVGDYLVKVIMIPGTAAAGAVTITDGNGSAITIYAGGAVTPLPALVPFEVNLGIKCVNATTPGWKVTTGANITAIGVGNFT